MGVCFTSGNVVVDVVVVDVSVELTARISVDGYLPGVVVNCLLFVFILRGVIQANVTYRMRKH